MGSLRQRGSTLFTLFTLHFSCYKMAKILTKHALVRVGAELKIYALVPESPPRIYPRPYM